VDFFLAVLVKRLNLTADQEEQIEPAIEEYFQQLRKAMEELQAIRADMRNAQKKFESSLRPILSQEQTDQYLKLSREMRERIRKRVMSASQKE